MKSITILVMGMFFLVAMTGCGTSKETTKETISTADTKAEARLLNRDYIKNLSEVDILSIQYYNSDEVSLSVNQSNRRTEIENGVLYGIDSTKLIDKKIYALTFGRVIKIGWKNKSPDTLLVSFDKDDPVVRFWFYADINGNYNLQSSKEVTRQHVKYKLSTTALNKCQLYFVDGTKRGLKVVSTAAKGDPVGTTTKSSENNDDD